MGLDMFKLNLPHWGGPTDGPGSQCAGPPSQRSKHKSSNPQAKKRKDTGGQSPRQQLDSKTIVVSMGHDSLFKFNMYTTSHQGQS